MQYDLYEGKSQNAKTFPILYEEQEVIPGWGDLYVNAEILLLRGDKMTRGQVVQWKQDVDGSPISKFNQNAIFIYAFMRWNFLKEKL